MNTPINRSPFLRYGILVVGLVIAAAVNSPVFAYALGVALAIWSTIQLVKTHD